MTSGTPPNTSIVLTAQEIAFIERRYNGSKSQAIHQGLAAIMPVKSNDNFQVNPAAEPFIEALRPLVLQHRYDLDNIQEAIQALRVEQMVAELRSRGLGARCQFSVPPSNKTEAYQYQTNYVLVYAPAGTDLSNEWATVEECRRLLDTLANLEPTEAFRRWLDRIEPFDSTYTRQDAERDMHTERAALRQQYQDGQLDGEIFRIAHGQAADFMDYVTPKQPGEAVQVQFISPAT